MYMDNSFKILIVEDEMIIGAKISMHLVSLGYEVTGILPRGEEVLLHFITLRFTLCQLVFYSESEAFLSRLILFFTYFKK